MLAAQSSSRGLKSTSVASWWCLSEPFNWRPDCFATVTRPFLQSFYKSAINSYRDNLSIILRRAHDSASE